MRGQCVNKLIVDLIEGSRNVTCQPRTNHITVICVFLIQYFEGVIRLKVLPRSLCWVYVGPVCKIHTSLAGSVIDKVSVGALLTSSISSAPAISTIHRLRVAILNKPGFD